MRTTLSDIVSGLRQWRLWSLLALEDFKATYKRTLIGPLWVAASFAAFVGVKIFIFGSLNQLGGGEYFSGYVTLGFMMWTYLANAVNSGVNAFTSSRNWILGVSMPYSVFIFQKIALSLLNLAFVVVAAALILTMFMSISAKAYLLALSGIAVTVISLFWVQLLLAVLGVFFRDIIQLVSTIMRIMFFLTPIIWMPAAIGARANFVQWNPFTHYLAIVRAPILDGELPLISLYIVFGIGGLAAILAIFAFGFARKYIPSYI
jgi:ABC-type polysaccharide/polyol phosphate export permease